MTRIPYTKSAKRIEKIQRPHRENSKPVLPKDHFCYGCKHYGLPCIRPCYRDRKNSGSEEVHQ